MTKINELRNLVISSATWMQLCRELSWNADLDIYNENPAITKVDAIKLAVDIWYNANKAVIDLAQTDKGIKELKSVLTHKKDPNTGKVISTTRTFTDAQIKGLKQGIPVFRIEGSTIFAPDGVSHLVDIHTMDEKISLKHAKP